MMIVSRRGSGPIDRLLGYSTQSSFPAEDDLSGLFFSRESDSPVELHEHHE